MNNDKLKDLQLLLNLMFDRGEKVCASPTVHASFSKDKYFVTDRDQFLTINPINGWRQQKNLCNLRNFLIESDPLGWSNLNEEDRKQVLIDQQKDIEQSGMPFSAKIYSGNKSFHYIISLTEPLNHINEYKHYFKWLRRILPSVDKAGENPITSTRVPGHFRIETKKYQTLEFIGSRVPINLLLSFLKTKPELECPDGISPCFRKVEKKRYPTSELVSFRTNSDKGELSLRTKKFLITGDLINDWHREFVFVVKDLKAQGYSQDEAIEILMNVTGALDENDIYQIEYGYKNNEFELSYRPRNYFSKTNTNRGGTL